MGNEEASFVLQMIGAHRCTDRDWNKFYTPAKVNRTNQKTKRNIGILLSR